MATADGALFDELARAGTALKEAAEKLSASTGDKEKKKDDEDKDKDKGGSILGSLASAAGAVTGAFGLIVGAVTPFVAALSPASVELFGQAMTDLLATVGVALQPLME